MPNKKTELKKYMEHEGGALSIVTDALGTILKWLLRKLE